MNEKVVDAARFHGHFPIFRRHSFDLSVDIDSHYSRLHPEVLGLELVKVGWGAFRPIRAVDQLAQIVRDGALNIVAISLAEKKTPSWWRFEELRCQKATKSGVYLPELADACNWKLIKWALT